jgi:hypothetical protein
MSQSNPNRFSGPVTIFHERSLPERATPTGYAALIDAFLGTPRGLSVPLPRQPSAAATAPSILLNGVSTRRATNPNRLSKVISLSH